MPTEKEGPGVGRWRIRAPALLAVIALAPACGGKNKATIKGADPAPTPSQTIKKAFNPLGVPAIVARTVAGKRALLRFDPVPGITAFECSADLKTWVPCEPAGTEMRALPGWSGLASGQGKVFVRGLMAGKPTAPAAVEIVKENLPPSFDLDATMEPSVALRLGMAPWWPQGVPLAFRVPHAADADHDPIVFRHDWLQETAPGSGAYEVARTEELASGVPPAFLLDASKSYRRVKLRSTPVDPSGATGAPLESAPVLVAPELPTPVLISGEPPPASPSRAVAVSLGGDHLASVRYVLLGPDPAIDCDAATYPDPLPSPARVESTLPSDGRYLLCARGTDLLGREQATAQSRAFVVDTVPPTVAVLDAPASLSRASMLDAGLDPSGGASKYDHALLAPGAAGDCGSAAYGSSRPVSQRITAPLLQDGLWRLCVKAFDDAGNGTPAPAELTWTRDTTPPAVSVLAGPPSGFSNATQLNVGVSGAGLDEYVSLVVEDGSPCPADSAFPLVWKPAATPITASLGSDGPKRLCVRGRDLAGNEQSGTTSATWTKDTVAPTATLAGAPAAVSADAALAITVGPADDAHEYRYALLEGTGGDCQVASYSLWRSATLALTAPIGADGGKTLCVRARDQAGNAQSTATARSWTRDSAPVVAILGSTPSSRSSASSLAVTVSGVNDYAFALVAATSTCASATYSSFRAVATPITASTGTDGAKRLCVKGRNAGGAEQSGATEHTWTKDTASPTATLTFPPAALSAAARVTSLVGPSGDATSYRFAILPGALDCTSASYSAWTPLATTLDEALGADGGYRLCLLARDEATNAQVLPTEIAWTKDTTPPVATLTGAPSAATNATALAITVGPGGDVVSYQQALVPGASDCVSATYGAWVAVGTAITDSLGSDGAKRLCVRGKDGAGNEQSNPTSYAFTKDTVAPSAQLSGLPLPSSSVTSLFVTVDSTDVDQYRTALLSGAGSTCSGATYSAWTDVATPITTSTGSDGGKRLCVLARDLAGNAQSTPTEHTWTKDTSSPTATLSGLPTALSNATTLAVTVGPAGDAAAYRFALLTGPADCSGASYGAWTSAGTTLSGSTGVDGAKRLCVLARDAALNAQVTPTEFAWTLDTAAPTAALSNLPNATSSAASLNVNVGPTEVHEYRFALLGAAADCSAASYGSWIPRTTAITQALGADGAKRLCVQARDETGNVQGSPTEAAWVKDSNALSAAIGGAPSAESQATSLSVTISGTDVVDYQWALIPAAQACAAATYSGFVSVGTPLTVPIGADGAKRLCVKGRNGTSTVQSTATEATWVKDTAAPSATLSGTPANLSGATSLSVQVGPAGDATEYRHSLLSGAADCSTAVYGSWRAVSTVITDALGADGAKRLCVEARDLAGNAQASATTFSWTKDTTPPAGVTLSNTPAVNSSQASLAVTVSGADVFEYTSLLLSGATDCSTADLQSWIAVGTDITTAIGADGTKILCVKGRDAAGNQQSGWTSALWLKDTAAPTATVAGVPTGANAQTTLAVTVGPAGDVAHYRFALLAGSSDCSAATYSGWTAQATAITSTIGADGAKTLCVLGRDATGNAQSTATTRSWTKDSASPTATLANAPSTAADARTVLDIEVGPAGDVVDYRYALVASAAVDCTSVTYSTYRPLATRITDTLGGDGDKALCVLGRDAAGNAQTTATLLAWKKDTTAPTATLAGAPATRSNASALDVTVGPADDVTEYRHALLFAAADCSGAAYSAWTPIATKVTTTTGSDGAKRLCVLGRDAAGNEQTVATTLAWTLDTVPPSITLGNTPASTTYDASLDVSVTLDEGGEYRYALLTGAADCSGASYSAWRSTSLHITDGVGAAGTKLLCVQARDTAGNERLTPATAAFTKTAGGVALAWSGAASLSDACEVSVPGTATFTNSAFDSSTGTLARSSSTTASATGLTGLLTDFTPGAFAATWNLWGTNGAAASLSKNVTLTSAQAGGRRSLGLGHDHSCLVTSGGNVKCWGDNSSKQCGHSGSDSHLPITIGGITNAVQVVGGDTHSCALLSDGTVRCWGDNTFKQLGDPSGSAITNTTLPRTVTGLSDAVALTSGERFTCALLSSGGVRCWGSNDSAQLGVSTATPDSDTPLTIPSLSEVVQISAGHRHVCALLSDTTVKCWGDNASMQSGTTDTTSDYPTPQPIAGLADVRSVTSGGQFSCVLTMSGSAQCWGDNSMKQIGVAGAGPFSTAQTAPISDVIALQAGWQHACALVHTPNLGVRCWGSNSDAQLGVATTTTMVTETPQAAVGAFTRPVQLALGSRHGCAVQEDGLVRCWGANAEKAVGVSGAGPFSSGQATSSTLARPTLQAASPAATFARDVSPGREAPHAGCGAACSDNRGMISAGGGFTCALARGGRVRCWGDASTKALVNHDGSNSWTPRSSSFTNARAVSSGADHACAVLSDGTVECWGANAQLQLGRTSPTTPTSVSAAVTGVSGAVSVGAGKTHTCALLGGGTVQCWGDNTSKQLGEPMASTITPTATPQTVTGLTDAIGLAVGESHACALRSDRTVQCWGSNNAYQLGTDADDQPRSTPVTVTGLSDVLALAAGDDFNCALLANASVKCWGSNSNLQLGTTSATTSTATPNTVTGLTAPVAITAGSRHVCALESTGAAKCWGENATNVFQIGFSTAGNYDVPKTVANFSNFVALSAGLNHTCGIAHDGATLCWGANGLYQGGTDSSTGATATPRATDFVDALRCLSYSKYGITDP